MTRRDWLAALSMLSTRRRLDLRSTSFKAFVAAALQQEELLKPRHVHLTIHRLAVIGYAPALWQLALRLQPLLQQQQLTGKQLAVSAWGLAKNGITHPPVWDLIGMEALRLASCLTLSDLSMIIWAFARVERMKPAEIVKLKEEVLNRLDAFVKQALFAAYPMQQGQGASSAASAATQTLASPATGALTAPCAAAAPPVTPHDLCMLMRSFADLTPRDSPLILRLLYTLLLACRVQPSAHRATAAAGSAADVAHSAMGVPQAVGGVGPLTAQGLTAVWTALKDAEVAKVFSLPQHKRPLSSSSGSRHLAYLPFRDTIPLECLPLLLAILKPAQSYLRDASTGTDASVTLEPTAQTPHTVKEETEFSKLEEASALPPETLRMAAAAVASGAAGLKSNALLRGACCDVLLEVLCEETRLLRLDHTTNTSMVAALAAALADMQLVDPRVVYQLVLFAQQRGAAQFQGDQLLTVLQAFEKCQIADSKAWAKLAHRAQDIAADLNLKGLRRLRKLTWRAGHSNARLEGVFDHFEALKEDIEKCGPI
ncbi:uncharacterized protein LOC34618868 [Cyclospora cayetanensis]|uniref:Uncharacterized protein LOC34618868 n=1 Tax=Cyclospora cayetanensis TaxID=88456 RepID=A0A6P6S1B0_9EIME|nr:uncharacterized protein LOC34618868 [Cyclospora cayetanensis]